MSSRGRIPSSASTVVLLSIAFATALVRLAAQQASVQITLNTIAAIKVSGGNITLSVTAPAATGGQPQGATNNACYLQYSSVVSSGQTRTVTAAWGASTTAPSGCALTLTATPTAGTGTVGTSSGQITLSSSAQTIINGIAGCATGTGATNGAKLTYTLSVTSPTGLVANESKTATITFTLTGS
jgi:hypothetical protein